MADGPGKSRPGEDWEALVTPTHKIVQLGLAMTFLV